MREGSLTKLQVLVEFAKKQPSVKQSDVAKALGISPQAVSNYVSSLKEEGLLERKQRSRYRVTQEGVEWVSRRSRELKGYADEVLEKIVGGEKVWTAIADDSFEKGEQVYLEMKKGFLYATRKETSAKGITIDGVEKGEDVGVKHQEGIVKLKEGSITVYTVPGITEGGSRAYRKNIPEGILGCVGTEAYIVLKKAGKEPNFTFSAEEAAATACIHGIDVSLLVSKTRLPGVINKLKEREVKYEVID